jgi:hypothetical protein
MNRPAKDFSKAVKVLPLKAPGTAIALWRWGQTQVQRGRFNPTQRRAWENRLITTGLPLTRGYALRHALCWALAEGDEARFTELRTMTDATAEDIVTGFQRLFGMLGGPLPVLRLWSLPALEYQDQAFASAHRIWIYPLEEGPLPDVPEGTIWIIPSEVGAQDERNATLEISTQQEGKTLADRLSRAGRQAWFAPSRPALERIGLVWFPALLEVDEKGNLARIRMGDAGPRQP